jgi:phage/plasmid-like protein (TIGR03299 family)
MSHALSQNPDGSYEMMCVGPKPWHRLGTVLKLPPATAAEAITVAHLSWRVEKRQLYIGAEGRPFPREFAMVREDRWNLGEPEAVFGQVGEEYEPLQNTDAFQFFDPMIQKGEAFYESAGALYHGRCVWIMARLREDIEVVPGDLVERYLLLTHRHDGTGSIQVKFTPVRVVCQNTLNQALSEGPSFRVVHTKSVYARLDKAAEALSHVVAQSRKIGEAFSRMAAVKLNTERLEEYLKAVFPNPAPSEDRTLFQRAKVRIQRHRDRSRELWEAGTGNNLPNVRGTLWAAYNGVAEYADYGLTSARDSKWLDGVWFGESYRIKTLAFGAAMQVIENVTADAMAPR